MVGVVDTTAKRTCYGTKGQKMKEKENEARIRQNKLNGGRFKARSTDWKKTDAEFYMRMNKKRRKRGKDDGEK